MKQQFLLATIVAISSTSAMAEGLFDSSSSSDKTGSMYAGVSLGKSSLKGDTFGDGDTSSNWKIYGGYQLTPEISAEAAYHKIGVVDKALSNGDDLKLTGLSASGVYTMPVADKLSAFGKAGFMAWDSNAVRVRADKTTTPLDGTDVLLGAGATYKLDDNWGVRGEYEHVGGDLKANMYSVGATFSSF